MRVYKVVGNQIKGWKDRPEGYVLKENEIIGGVYEYPVYNVNTGNIEEGIDVGIIEGRLLTAKKLKKDRVHELFVIHLGSDMFHIVRSAFSPPYSIPNAVATKINALLTSVDTINAEIDALTNIEEVLAYEINLQ